LDTREQLATRELGTAPAALESLRAVADQQVLRVLGCLPQNARERGLVGFALLQQPNMPHLSRLDINDGHAEDDLLGELVEFGNSPLLVH
jgi:hypothetical protein